MRPTYTARENWLRASKELGFDIITPYKVNINDAEKEAFAFLPNVGRGVIICLTFPPKFDVDQDFILYGQRNSREISFINPFGYLEYNPEIFYDVLEDWNSNIGN